MTKPASTRRPVIDLADFTLDELDEVAKLQEQHDVGKTTAFAYIGLRRLGVPKSLDDCRKLTMRDVSIIETELDEDDTDTPTSAP